MDAYVPGRVRVRVDERRLTLLRGPSTLSRAQFGRGIRSWSSVALCAAVAGSCSPEPETATAATGPNTFLDAAGTAHTFDAPARRIVSLVPSATETLRAIGAGGTLVGRTDYDTEAWLADVPSVGGGLDPNIEVLIALRPDVVIRFEGTQDPRTPARLDELGIRHVAVRPSSLDDIYLTNAIVGRVTGRLDAADSLSAAIRSGLEELRLATNSLPSPTFAYVLGGTPPFVAGPDTYIEELLTILGGRNVFSDLAAPYATVSPEALRARQIDVVLVSGVGPYDESLTPDARIEMIGGVLESPGPGVVEAAWTVAEAMHGRVLR